MISTTNQYWTCRLITTCQRHDSAGSVQAVRDSPSTFAKQSLCALPAPDALGHVGRSTLNFVVVVLDFTLMLLAMTFNVGVFFAVCAGLALGTLLFSHVPRRYAERQQVRAIRLFVASFLLL
jgi:heme O synthase-like polyprenyltransferase